MMDERTFFFLVINSFTVSYFCCFWDISWFVIVYVKHVEMTWKSVEIVYYRMLV